jgi:8-oxo-dGTP pyrophosphatase MutT (NUDIX family)
LAIRKYTPVTKTTKNPWQTHSIQEVYDNPWITVSHREVTAPTGKDGIYGMVHFKNTAVGVVPIDSEGNTWLVGQHRYTINAYTWEIPEGGSASGENTLTTAKRELKEETGISASSWTQLFEMHTSNSVTDEYAIGYVAQGLSFGSAEPDDTEILQLKKMPLSDAVDMAMQGLITDSLAMVSLLKVQLLIDRGDLTV